MTFALAVAATLLSVVSYVAVSRQLEADLDRALLRETQAYAAALRAAPLGAAPSTGSATVLEASRAYLRGRTGALPGGGAILLVRTAEGRLLSNSDVPLEDALGEVRLLQPTTTRAGFSTVRLRGTAYRVATLPVKDADGTVVAVFQAALPTADIARLAGEVGWTLAAVGLGVTLLGASLSALLARASLTPLRQVADTAEEVTQSSLGKRVDYAGPDDEVGRTVRSLNAMLDRLEAAFAEQRRFIADASHELRTPLAVAAGHLELAQREGVSAEERREELDLVAAEVSRMGRLVDDLLALARLEGKASARTQKLESTVLVAEAVARARGLGERRFTVGTCPPVWVEGDPDQLEMALMNLLRNAVAHTDRDGWVEVSCRRIDGRVRIRVEDDGPGIRPDDLERIFDRFYRAQGRRSADSGGSGLGLAIVRRLVELHGGTVTAANRPEGGAMFTIYLPEVPAPTDGGVYA